MKHDRSRLQYFAKHYFGTKRHIGTAAAKKRAQAIRTIIIDTHSLSNEQLSLDRAIRYGGSGHDPLTVAQRALVGQRSILAPALPTLTSATAPVAILSGRVQGTVWHHGAAFTAAWVGPATSIAHHANLTDTEREQLLLQCRKLAAHGSTVYAVAYSEHAKAPTSYNKTDAQVVGLLVLHPHVHHGTEEVIARIREAGIAIVYASKDTEHTVQSFAAASLLAPNHAAPFVYRPGRTLPVNAELYASLTATIRQKLITSYPSEHTLVVDEPLPEFWHTFATFLK